MIGGQPLVLPNGNVVVPLDNASETALGYTVSTNGGAKFGQALTITSISAADDPGNIRSGPLPSAEIAGDGKIYVVWEDCRFRAGCPNAGTPNDLVYVTSTNGTTWSAVQRIPIDAVTSTVDYFLPGVGGRQGTSGGNTTSASRTTSTRTPTARSRPASSTSATSRRRTAARRGARRRSWRAR